MTRPDPAAPPVPHGATPVGPPGSTAGTTPPGTTPTGASPTGDGRTPDPAGGPPHGGADAPLGFRSASGTRAGRTGVAATVPAGVTAPAPTRPGSGPEPGQGRDSGRRPPAAERAVRVTWAQPEDLVGHELRQAAEDGRDPGPARRAWLAAGGHPAPERAGASPCPAGPELRALATRLLDELALLPSPLAADEPASWEAVRATWPAGAPGPRGTPGPPDGTRPGPAVPGRAAPGPRAPEPAPAAGPRLAARLEAAWLGRAAGCLLGKPVEKLPLAAIRALARATGNWPLNDWFTARGVPPELLAAHPWNRRSAPTSLAENIDGMPEDDDLNYPLLGLLLLQRHGKGFTTADVARLWLDELPAGRTFTAERVAYRNLLLGLEPPATATHHNPFREWIGALIRADVHGWTHPGNPAAAAAQAYRDATLTHTGNGVYAALLVAAATAEAATGAVDVHGALRAGLAVVPPRSRLAEAVRFAIAAAAEEPDFDRVVDALHARYGHYHWVHAVPNTALIAAALTHAGGDFTRSVCRAVSGGWDTDSNGATAGALAGLLAGSPDALPERWTAPLRNRLSTTVPGFDGTGFDTLAHLTAQEAARS
ncbi:ADP-ribosylglycohydrolase family protein [Streptomyces sp. NPDC058701]|uniref:ADP-ribosylglycohydrolase family protein n=1 Tax=Streptomyces sp. NPDC058701 TaxID=3346608 RepID=UPI00365424BA